MSFASGFFNSVDHDRLYDATDISRLFDGLIRDGIFASIGDCLVVKQSNQMNVTVGTGRAWFNHTWSYNDALYPVTIPPSEILMDRIDAIVLEINSVEAVRANSIKLIKGAPASTPTKPALTNTKEVHQYPLAYVTVGKEVTSIRQADIENCVGTSACPFVTGILEVISIEQLIPQWRDILNRFVEENTANFNTWMNGEKQDYQAWLTAAKKEITDWQATSKSDYQKWYDSIKNGYDQWFATIKAAYDANWSTFQQWEKTSQAEFDTWFENMKNKLEGDLGSKLTLETEKLGKEKVSLIESTKTDLVGTVEAPLMLGKATRNLLPYPYVKASGSVSHGVTMTYTEEGTVSLDGTISGSDNAQPGFVLYEHVEKLFNNSINTLYSKYDTTIAGTLHTFFQIFTKGNTWVTNVETLSKNDYDWTNYRCVYVIQYHKTSGDVHGTVSNIRIVTDADDPFVPYSGYDIKTCGKNLANVDMPTETNNGVTCTNNGDGTYTLNGTATAEARFMLVTNTSALYKRIVGKNVLFLNGGHKLKRDYIILFNVSNSGFTKWESEKYDGDSFVVPSGYANAVIDIHISSGTTVNNLFVKPMLTTDLNATNDDFVPYQDGGTVHIDSSTKFPNFDLKSFDGVTHIISPGNVQSCHADAPNGKYLLESIKKSTESGGISYGVVEPTNPKPGNLWINPASGSRIQYWTGSEWDVARALDATGSNVIKSNIKPSSSKGSTLWIDSGNGNAMKHVDEDGTVTELSSGGTYYGATAPTNTKLLWIDTSGVAKFYNGSAWVPLAAAWG